MWWWGGALFDAGCMPRGGGFGMDLIADRDLFWIARAGLKAPLPKPWKPCETSVDNDIFYFNFETGEVERRVVVPNDDAAD